MHTNQPLRTFLKRFCSQSALGFALAVATAQAASLSVDFQATIASEEHPTYSGEARFFHVSVNPDNPGTGSYAATIVGTNTPAPRFVRNFDGPVVAYKFAGGADDNINAVAQSGGDAGIITFTSTDTVFDGFAQQQAKLWTSTNPGDDIKVAGANPFGQTPDTDATGLWRSLSDATGTIDVSAIQAGSLHIYYGAFNGKPSVSVVMKDTDGVEPDIIIADAHLNGDTADRTEYYLAEIDFVTDGVYDEVQFVWNAGNGNGRGIAVVVTEAVTDAVDPSLDPVNITDNSGGVTISNATPLIYTITYSELMDPATISADDFELLGTASASITSVAHYGRVTTLNVQPTLGTEGTIQLQVKAGATITDLAGNTLDTTSAITDPDIIEVGDIVSPTVSSIQGPLVSGTIYGTPTITYTVTFSEFVNPINASNFTNAGTAPFTIGAVTQTSPAAPAPSVYTVEVIPSGAGTVQLEVQGTVEDPSANLLTVPVTDPMIYTLDTGAEPARETVLLNGSTTSDSDSSLHTLVFDASASDKVVVIVTGEHGNPEDLTGKVNSLTYDGVPMIKAVGRLPIGSAPSASFDQTYNDIWYLDDPAAATASANVNDPDLATAGNIRASLNTRGVITAIRLSGTAPGVGATVISKQEVKTVSILAATSGGMILASHGMGGNGNSANTQSVNTDPPAAELTAVKQGSDWNGHVTSRISVASPGVITATFTGGNTVGSHTLAAEFLGALAPTGTAYDIWAADNAPAPQTPEDDFDGDGVPNAVEFVLGGDKDTNDLGKLPVAATNGGNMTFTFVRDQNSIDSSTSLSIEVSTDLITWDTAPSPYVVPDGETVGPPVTVQKNEPVAGADTVTLSVPMSPDSKKFARLKVTISE